MAAKQPGEPASAAAAPFQPKSYDISRYQDIWSKSPFEFEIVVQAEEVVEDTTFDDLKLAGYSDRGNHYVVTIYDQKSPDEKIRIDSRKSAEDNQGFKIIGIHRGPSYKQTEVELEKNGATGHVGYDGKRLSRPLAAAAGGNARQPSGRARNNARATAARNNARGNANARNQNNARGSNPGNRNGQGGNNANSGGSNANGGTDRNAVIQRLLERARQNQAGGNGSSNSDSNNGTGTTRQNGARNNTSAPNNATNNGGGTTDNSAPRPRRRRVVLPPSVNGN